MRSAWLFLPFIALTGCDPVVATTGTEGEASTGAPTSDSDTSPATTAPTTTGIDPSSTTENPPTAGSESSTGGFGSSSGSTGSSTGSSSSGSSSESSSGSSSSTDPTGVGFIDPSDSGGEDECNPYDQDCGDGQKCNPWANDGGSNWNALDCFPLDPAMHQPGEACEVEESGVSGIDTCDVGSMCWDVDTDTNVGTCVAMCEGSPAAPTCVDPAATCVISNGGVLNLCLPGCDPLLQACPAGQGCYPIDPSFVCAPDASGADLGQAGDPCEFINVCDPGTACIEPDLFGPGCFGTGCCSDFCDLNEPSCDLPSQECLPWFEEGAAPPAFVDVGICSVPA